MAAADVLPGARAVGGDELAGVREHQPAVVRTAFLPARAGDLGRGRKALRLTVLVSAENGVGGDDFAANYGLDATNSQAVALGDGTGRATSGRRPVAAGALNSCTGVVLAGAEQAPLRRVMAALRAP